MLCYLKRPEVTWTEVIWSDLSEVAAKISQALTSCFEDSLTTNALSTHKHIGNSGTWCTNSFYCRCWFVFDFCYKLVLFFLLEFGVLICLKETDFRNLGCQWKTCVGCFMILMRATTCHTNAMAAYLARSWRQSAHLFTWHCFDLFSAAWTRHLQLLLVQLYAINIQLYTIIYNYI